MSREKRRACFVGTGKSEHILFLGHRGHGGEQLGMRFLKPSHHSSWRLQVQLSLSESIMAHPATATAEHLRRKRRSSCSQALALRAHTPSSAPSTEEGSHKTHGQSRGESAVLSARPGSIQPVLLGLLLGTQEPPEVTAWPGRPRGLHSN